VLQASSTAFEMIDVRRHLRTNSPLPVKVQHVVDQLNGKHDRRGLQPLETEYPYAEFTINKEQGRELYNRHQQQQQQLGTSKIDSILEKEKARVESKGLEWEVAIKEPTHGQLDELTRQGRAAYNRQQQTIYGDVTQGMMEMANTQNTTVEHLLAQNVFDKRQKRAWNRRERALKISAVYTALVNDLQSSMNATKLTKEQLFELLQTLEDDVLEMCIGCVERGEHVHFCLGGLHRMPQFDEETATVYDTCESPTERLFYDAASNTIKKEKKRTFYCVKSGQMATGQGNALLFCCASHLLVLVLNIFFQLIFLSCC
jgi:hypothetical protein